MSELSATSYVVQRGGRLRQFARWLNALSLSKPLWEAVAIAALCPLLLSAALWNGFPLIFYDTGAYMLQSFAGRFVPERSPVFSLFLLLGGGGISLWLVCLLETVMAAFVMVETARALAPRITLPVMMLVALGLTMFTALPWYAGQIEPDIFTPLVVLTLYLLAFHARRLGWWRCFASVAIGALAAATHPSHLGLAAGLVLVVIAYWLITRFTGRAWPAANPLPPALGVALAFGMTFAANYHYTRHVFVSRAGPVFMVARMLQDGVVQKLLDETCPTSNYMLCRYRKVLPHRADKWLWGPGTPFVKLHRFLGTEKESERIVRDALQRYPLWNAELAARDALQQFTLFYTGDQIEPQQWVLYRDFHAFIPDQLSAYSLARQQKGDLHFWMINLVHVPVGFLILGLLFAAFGRTWWTGDGRAAGLLGFILLALIGNAVICGVFSNPHARYESRLLWVPAYALTLLAVDRRSFALKLA